MDKGDLVQNNINDEDFKVISDRNWPSLEKIYQLDYNPLTEKSIPTTYIQTMVKFTIICSK